MGGGKGGVGKSFVSVNLAIAAARRGLRVVLVDGDLGGANLDTLLGCPPPEHTLAHFFGREVAKLSDLAAPTGVEGLSLIAGDPHTLGGANPHHAQKLKLIRHLRKLPASLVLLDLGAGTTFNTLDLYLAADLRLCVTVPEPTALQNAFSFIKAATLRDLERLTGVKQRERAEHSIRGKILDDDSRRVLETPTRLVVNRARAAEGRQVTNVLTDLASRFLGTRVLLAGVVREDPAVKLSVQRGTPLLEMNPASGAASDLTALACALLTRGKRRPKVEMGLNETVQVGHLEVHLQTEDLGSDHGAVRSQVFLADGSVLYSRRTPYQDAFFTRLKVSPNERARYHHVAMRRALQTGRIPLDVRRSA